MELTYDWRSFQNIFYPRRKLSALRKPETVSPLYLVVDGEIVVCAYADSEDRSDLIGLRIQDFVTSLDHRKLFVLEKSEVSQWIEGARACPHFLDQIEYLKSKALPRVNQSLQVFEQINKSQKGLLRSLSQKHFILSSLDSWWSRLFPASFGFYIRIEGQVDQDFLMIVRGGEVELFHEPDLTSLGIERSRLPSEVVQYLSKKHMLPVQGLVVPHNEWAEWCDSGDHWKEIWTSLSKKRSKLVPSGLGLRSLIWMKAFLGI